MFLVPCPSSRSLPSGSSPSLQRRYVRAGSVSERPSSVAPRTVLLADEFGDWEGSKRRIDLLAPDKPANLELLHRRGLGKPTVALDRGGAPIGGHRQLGGSHLMRSNSADQ